MLLAFDNLDVGDSSCLWRYIPFSLIMSELDRREGLLVRLAKTKIPVAEALDSLLNFWRPLVFGCYPLTDITFSSQNRFRYCLI